MATDPLTVNEVVTEFCNEFRHLIIDQNWESGMNLSLVQLEFLSKTGGVMLNHMRSVFQVTYHLDIPNSKITVNGAIKIRVKMATMWLSQRLQGIFFNTLSVTKTISNRGLVDSLKTIRRDCATMMIDRKEDSPHRYFALSIDEDKSQVYIKIIGLRDNMTYTTPSIFGIVHERVMTLLKSSRDTPSSPHRLTDKEVDHLMNMMHNYNCDQCSWGSHNRC